MPGRARAEPLAKVPACAARHIGAALLDNHPPPLIIRTCARHSSASAPQCPASARRAPVHNPPPPACALAQASHAAQWPRLPQAPGAATEPLRGPRPATARSNGTCAGHCSASATQCPATERRAPVHHPPPPASARAQASHAAQWHRPVHTVPQAPRCGPVGTTEPLGGPQPSQFPVHEPHWCAGHCFARAQQCPAFRLFWLASGVGKVSAPRASVRALERCHRRHASLRLVLAASPARWRRRPLEHRAHVPGRALSSPVGQGPGLRAPSHRRLLVHDPPQPTRPALAPGTAPLALRNARLPKQPPRCTTRLTPARSKACAQKPAQHQRNHHARPPAATTPAATPIRMRPSPLRLFMRCSPHDIWAVDLTR
jgi:hypothetical protein